MTRFVTISKATKDPVLLWDDADMSVVSRHASVDEVPDAEGLEVHAFSVDTTDTMPTWLDRTRANQGRNPVYDADGRPLWSGARVSFRLPSYYVNTYAGEAEFRAADEHGGYRLRCDREHDVFGPGGTIVRRDREQYATRSDYQRDGALKGALLLRGSLGDPHEHGRTECFVRLEDDPRRVSTLDHVVGTAPKGP